MKQGVFDEEVIKDAYQQVFQNTHNQFSEYVRHRKNSVAFDAWVDFEGIIERWDQEDKAKNPRRKPTGADSHLIRAKKSKGG